jgi:LmbE family N-acetylglucosaminyl deacetylase
MRLLVIAPHADDETFGCGGTIASRVAAGHEVHVVVASLSDVYVSSRLLKNSAAQRHEELGEALRRLGVQQHTLLGFDENRLDQVAQVELITRLDEVLAAELYDQIFFPSASHHQDHRAIFHACSSALRRAERRPRLVALYEHPCSSWAATPPPGGRYYVDVSRHLERKLDALCAYESQLREPPHELSIDAVRKLAALRGVECGVEYAEMFHLLWLRD